MYFGGFFFELLAKLPRHRACAAHPAADLADRLRQLFRAEHDERQTGDHQQFAEADFEHEWGVATAGGRDRASGVVVGVLRVRRRMLGLLRLFGEVGVGGLAFVFVRWRRANRDDEEPRPTSRRRIIIVAGIVVVAAGAGWLVAASSGQRLPGQSSSGGIEDSTASLLSQARQLNFSDPQKSVELYSQVLEVNPDNVEALTYRAWMVALVSRDAADDVKLVAVATALEGLNKAIAVDPAYADAYCFMGIVKFRFAGDAQGAKEALDVCEANNPPAEVAGFVESIRAEVDAALGQ